MKNSWNKLPLASNSSLPTLYAKYDLAVTNCHITLTDLTRVWSEDLTRKQILQRAAELGTSIDPGEDSEQLNVLLQKVQDALQRKDKTWIQLTAAKRSTGLKLKTLTHLPIPFQPLEWYFNLSLSEQGAITKELLLPLLQDHEGMVEDTKALTSILEEKDHVISKLMDKIEGSGLNLIDVFPSLRGRKTTSRSAVESSISGLSEFDTTKFRWRSETARQLLDHGEHGFGFFIRDDLASLKQGTPEDQWWTKIKEDFGSEFNEFNGERNGSDHDHRPQSPSQTSDDGFQTQTPLLRRRLDPEDVTIPEKLSPSPKPAAQPEKKKLGKIGGTKLSPTKQALDKSTCLPERKAPSMSPPRSLEKPRSPSPKTTASPAAKQKGRLGTIGGNRKEKPSIPELVLDASHRAKGISPMASPRPKSRLGYIGGKQGSATTEKEKEGTSIPPTKHVSQQPTEAASLDEIAMQEEPKMERKTKSPIPEETKEEKADRKRQELKRQLDAKAKAPVKKKRKF